MISLKFRGISRFVFWPLRPLLNRIEKEINAELGSIKTKHMRLENSVAGLCEMAGAVGKAFDGSLIGDDGRRYPKKQTQQ